MSVISFKPDQDELSQNRNYRKHYKYRDIDIITTYDSESYVFRTKMIHCITKQVFKENISLYKERAEAYHKKAINEARNMAKLGDSSGWNG